MVDLLLGGQGKEDFMRFKKTVTKVLVASDSPASIVTPRGITEDSFEIMSDNFKNQAFKDFAARYQVNYLWQNLHMQAHRGDCWVMRRETPGSQLLFGVCPKTRLECPSH